MVGSITTASRFANSTCRVDADVELDQQGSALAGRILNSLILCALPFADGDMEGEVVGLVNLIDRESVRLSAGTCDILGVVAGDPADLIDAEMTCPTNIPGEDTVVTFTGPVHLGSARAD
jgi:hypothetical protein